jgi:hypothetical protein
MTLFPFITGHVPLMHTFARKHRIRKLPLPQYCVICTIPTGSDPLNFDDTLLPPLTGLIALSISIGSDNAHRLLLTFKSKRAYHQNENALKAWLATHAASVTSCAPVVATLQQRKAPWYSRFWGRLTIIATVISAIVGAVEWIGHRGLAFVAPDIAFVGGSGPMVVLLKDRIDLGLRIQNRAGRGNCRVEIVSVDFEPKDGIITDVSDYHFPVLAAGESTVQLPTLGYATKEGVFKCTITAKARSGLLRWPITQSYTGTVEVWGDRSPRCIAGLLTVDDAGSQSQAVKSARVNFEILVGAAQAEGLRCKALLTDSRDVEIVGASGERIRELEKPLRVVSEANTASLIFWTSSCRAKERVQLAVYLESDAGVSKEEWTSIVKNLRLSAYPRAIVTR